jgi:hypothetical protein
MSTSRDLVRRIMNRIDAWYYERHQLRPVGPALHIGCSRYRGPDMEFADGTVLRDNEMIGTLHFNNAGLSALGDGSVHRAGFRFARLMRQSLRMLAENSESDPELRNIRVYYGITWLPDHGNVVGFVSKPLPGTLRNRLIKTYLRLLMWTFAPKTKATKRAAVQPRAYWLTRGTLAQNLGKLKLQ